VFKTMAAGGRMGGRPKGAEQQLDALAVGHSCQSDGAAWGNQKTIPTERNSLPTKASGRDGGPLTHPLTGTADSGCEPLRETDPDLARVVTAWPGLPPHVKAAVLALVGIAPHPRTRDAFC
jgi:hypothetical protein